MAMKQKIEVFTAVKAKEHYRNSLKDFAVKDISSFRLLENADEWKRKAAVLRKKLIDFYMRGHPDGIIKETPEVEWTDTIETGAGYRIRKLRFEGYPGLEVPALLYEPEDLSDPVPAVLNPNGHHAGGKAMTYKQARCINLAKRGMLALNFEFLGMGELSASRRHWSLAHLELLGLNAAGIFYLIMKRALDVLCSHSLADPGRIAVTGLSGGGWQTVLLSALDERVRVSVPVAGHSPVKQRAYYIEDIGDPEQLPADLCSIADYDTITALIAPRPLLLIYNEKDDCCFQSERTIESVYKPVRALYEMLGAGDKIDFYSNTDPGTHNYEADNRSRLYQFLARHFHITAPEADLPFEDELLTEGELTVGIRPGNADILSLSRNRSRRLRETGQAQAEAAGSGLHAADKRRKELQHLLRLPEISVHRIETMAEPDTAAGPVPQLLHCSGGPGIPVLRYQARGIGGTAEKAEQSCLLFVSDEGKDAVFSDPEVGRTGAPGALTVYALDLLGTGEARPFAENKYQYHLVLSAAGRPTLGILAAQITAAARRFKEEPAFIGVRLAARGQVSMLASLCAAALEPGLISRVETFGLPDSLHRFIDWPVSFEDAAPAFCFGLLERFDIPELIALAAGLTEGSESGVHGMEAAGRYSDFTEITDSQRGII